MKTIVEVDNKQYVRDVIVYNSETQEPLVVTDSTPLLYLQRRGFKNIKTKEVPETWEELKELCREYNGKGLLISENSIEIGGTLVYSNMIFTYDGAIYLNTDCIFVEKISIPQMWQIIKGLRGGE